MAGDSIDVTARTYHTENGVVHAEGETYAVTDKALAETLRGIGFVSIAGWTDAGAGTLPPVLTALVPNTVTIGSPSLTLHVQGTGFTDASVITFAGHDEPTTRVSPTEVTTGIDMAVWLGPDTVPVTVRNGTGAASNAVSFTFTAARRAR
jgi:hypothetical protein